MRCKSRDLGSTYTPRYPSPHQLTYLRSHRPGTCLQGAPKTTTNIPNAHCYLSLTTSMTYIMSDEVVDAAGDNSIWMISSLATGQSQTTMPLHLCIGNLPSWRELGVEDKPYGVLFSIDEQVRPRVGCRRREGHQKQDETMCFRTSTSLELPALMYQSSCTSPHLPVQMLRNCAASQ